MPGIFDAVAADLFATYAVSLRYRDRVVGGTPSTARLIEGWLRSKMGLTQEQEIRELTIQTLREIGLADDVFDENDQVKFATLAAAAEAIAKKSHTTMFKRDASGLYIESRTVKSMLKECVAVLFPGAAGATDHKPEGAKVQRWGLTGKGPRSATAEWVFVNPDHISLGVMEPDGIDLSIGHITDRNGTRSTLDYYEYVEQATISFEVMVLQDRVPVEKWPAIWRYAQESGLSSKRSQGFGRFDVLAWERTP